MSKTSLDFGFLRRQSKSEGSALSSRPLRKQKFTSTGSKGHGLWFVNFDPFWGYLLLLNFRVRVCLKSAMSFPALCLVNREDLRFDVLLVLLCDVNFSPFISQVFLAFLLKHGKFRLPRLNCSYRASTSRRNTDMGGWKRIGTFPPTFNFATLPPLFDKQGLDAMVTVWLTSKKTPRNPETFLTMQVAYYP